VAQFAQPRGDTAKVSVTYKRRKMGPELNAEKKKEPL
jgi:hypothetical protein